MFQRWSAVSVDANAGIAVPVTPTEIFRYIIAGVTAAITAAVPIAGGCGLSAQPRVRRPVRARRGSSRSSPRRAAPSATSSGFFGSSSAASLPSAAANRWFSAARSAGGFFAATAAMIESSSARATAALVAGQPRRGRRAHRSRKPTASLYSSAEMSRPLSSTPLPYSSTATLTMFATR